MQRWIYERNRRPENADNQWRSFTAIPQGTNDVIHVRFDTMALIQVVNLLMQELGQKKVDHHKKVDWKDKQYDDYWGRFIKLDKINVMY